MITKPTVFVLGAGASQPYGLPTAGEIADAVRSEFVGNGGPITMRLTECGVSREEVRTCFEAFSESGQYSLDAFVIRRPEFRVIAKLVLATRLMESENDTWLSPPTQDDWYRFVFARMMPKDRDAFKANRLSVVTFNFDRSFEQRLLRALKGTYGAKELEAASLSTAIPILHVHGQLGALPHDGESGRPYAVEQQPDQIAKYARDIKLIDDEIDQDLFRRAADLLNEATTICFLGFSFQKDNLDRLHAESLGQKALFGTCKGMSAADENRVYDYFHSHRKAYLFGVTVRAFFDVVDLF